MRYVCISIVDCNSHRQMLQKYERTKLKITEAVIFKTKTKLTFGSPHTPTFHLHH